MAAKFGHGAFLAKPLMFIYVFVVKAPKCEFHSSNPSIFIGVLTPYMVKYVLPIHYQTDLLV